MSNFRVGQKVVCVDADLDTRSWHSDKPSLFGKLEVGKVYTVARVYQTYGWYRDQKGVGVCLELVEVKKTPCPTAPHCNGYNAKRFRPVVERKTDISIFKAMLNTTPEQVGV